MIEKNIIRVAAYIRVSSEKQAKYGDSLREQIETLMDYINKNENMVLVDQFIDDGVSGQKIKRDDFSRLMIRVKNRELDLIVFTKLDRWFRSMRHYLNTQEILQKNNVAWLAVAQPFFETRTAHGRAFIQQSMAWAELEAQNTSERIKAVNANKVRNGEVISGTVPLGYKVQDKKLVPDENSVIAIAIFEHYRRYSSLSKAVSFLADTYNIHRSPKSIRCMLKNTKYIGVYRDNQNYCEPIIEKGTFNEVALNLSRNIKSNQKYQYIFSGLVVCHCCNRKMGASKHSSPGGPRKDGTRKKHKRSTYRCKGHFDSKDCCNKKITFESVLERYMIDGLRQNLLNYKANYQVKQAPAINYDLKRKNIEKKIERLKALYLNEIITLDEFKVDRAKLISQIEEIPHIEVEEKNFSHIDNILASNIDEVYHSMDILEKQEFWRGIVKEIRIDENKNINPIFL